MITMLQGDCMDLMRDRPDKAYDLAIVDPPYGIGMGCGAGETRGIGGNKKRDLYTPKKWDENKPDKTFFDELFRVSKNQIIWGGNYFSDLLPISRGWIYWRKMMGGNYSDGELAFTSFDMVLKEYTKRSEQGYQRFHPTQKPVKLYEWLLMNYAKPGDKILDTHGGSGSICIACHNLGFDLDWIELDPDYYRDAVKRFENHKAQLRIF
jgi:site-specific DNA-methyltransferase (adenine-specific)